MLKNSLFFESLLLRIYKYFVQAKLNPVLWERLGTLSVVIACCVFVDDCLIQCQDPELNRSQIHNTRSRSGLKILILVGFQQWSTISIRFAPRFSDQRTYLLCRINVFIIGLRDYNIKEMSEPVFRIRDIWYGSGSSDPYLWPTDPALSSVTFKMPTKYFADYFWRYINIMLQRLKVINKSQNCSNQDPDPFLLLTDTDPDPGSGSVRPRGLQRDVVYLGWPIAPSYEPKCRERGGVTWSQPMSTAVHRTPNKLWRSNSIFTYGEDQKLRIKITDPDQEHRFQQFVFFSMKEAARPDHL